MRLDATGPLSQATGAQKAYTQSPAIKPPKSGESSGINETGSEKLTLSDNARIMLAAKNILKTNEFIREPLVKDIQEKLAKGTYLISDQDLAVNMLAQMS